MKGRKILLTGGTGSFGKKFVDITLERREAERILIYSRDEMKQWEMKNAVQDERVEFILGDVRDSDRLNEACKGVDTVVHAAATKIVPTAETNPTECIKTNIDGAINVIKCAKANKINKVVALSTDKACNPINLYGATKLASDKLFVAANAKKPSEEECAFSVVRYGNVMCSRGSVIPFFYKQREKGIITITDERMTRFMLSLQDAVELVWTALDESAGGELYVKKIPSISVLDIAEVVAPDCEKKIIGIRPGEKLHEQMISEEDSFYTYDFENYFKIVSPLMEEKKRNQSSNGGSLVNEGFSYRSDTNTNWLEKEELKVILTQEYGLKL